MLLRGLTWLVLFQLLGTALNHLFVPVLPGPIIGLLLLLGFLVVRGQVSEPLSQAASGLLRYLPLLLVPPAVGESRVRPSRVMVKPRRRDVLRRVSRIIIRGFPHLSATNPYKDKR